MIVEVVPYDPAWPAHFERERHALFEALPAVIGAVHHIGSTSVEGLAAKPIIDMLMEVRSLRELDATAESLAALGYEALGEYGIAGRRYFRKGGMRRTHQIHAFATGDENILRHLAFRDYLISNPDVRVRYAELKIGLAASCNNDIDTYCAGKDAFVKHHEQRALALRAAEQRAKRRDNARD